MIKNLIFFGFIFILLVISSFLLKEHNNFIEEFNYFDTNLFTGNLDVLYDSKDKLTDVPVFGRNPYLKSFIISNDNDNNNNTTLEINPVQIHKTKYGSNYDYHFGDPFNFDKHF